MITEKNSPEIATHSHENSTSKDKLPPLFNEYKTEDNETTFILIQYTKKEKALNEIKSNQILRDLNIEVFKWNTNIIL